MLSSTTIPRTLKCAARADGGMARAGRRRDDRRRLGVGDDTVACDAARGVGCAATMNAAWLADLIRPQVMLAAILSIAGIVASIAMFRLGVRRGRQEREEDRVAAAARDADARIDAVVQRYADLVLQHQTSALHGLLVAGIKNLRTSDEIRLARERATARTSQDPLGQYALEGVDLKKFIDAAMFDGLQVTNDRELRERFSSR